MTPVTAWMTWTTPVAAKLPISGRAVLSDPLSFPATGVRAVRREKKPGNQTDKLSDLSDAGTTRHSRLGDLALVLRDVHGARARAALILRLLSARLSGRSGGPSGGAIRVPFHSFDAEFQLSQGEISPYAQMLRDISAGIIPLSPDLETWNVVDCGANVGLFSLFLKDAARIVAVEPNPEVNRRLQRNLKANGLNASVVEAAISDRDGEVKMDFGRGPSVLATVSEEGVSVRALSIDTLLEEQGVTAVDLLKLDLEGHEIEALRGGAKALEQRRIRRIIAEFNDSGALDDLDEHLRQHGYQRVKTGLANARFELGP